MCAVMQTCAILTLCLYVCLFSQFWYFIHQEIAKSLKKKVRKVIDINVELHTAPCVYVRGARLWAQLLNLVDPCVTGNTKTYNDKHETFIVNLRAFIFWLYLTTVCQVWLSAWLWRIFWIVISLFSRFRIH